MVVDDDAELPALGKPEVLADVDYAHVVGLCAEQPDEVPSWYSNALGAELRRSQVRSWLLLCPGEPHKSKLPFFWPRQGYIFVFCKWLLPHK